MAVAPDASSASGELGIGRQVEVGEEHQLRPQEPVLVGLGLFDLEHELRTPRVVGAREIGAGQREVAIGDGRSRSRATLDEDAVPVRATTRGPRPG